MKKQISRKIIVSTCILFALASNLFAQTAASFSRLTNSPYALLQNPVFTNIPGIHSTLAGIMATPVPSQTVPEVSGSLASQPGAYFSMQLSTQPPLRLEAEVKLGEINLDSLGELEKLKPAGQGNPAVQFHARNLAHKQPLQRMGANKQHVKLWVTDGTTTHEAVWWNAGAGSLPVGKFDLAFAPTLNEFNDRVSVQLKVLDWRSA